MHLFVKFFTTEITSLKSITDYFNNTIYHIIYCFITDGIPQTRLNNAL